MGRTVSELQHSMTSRELSEWMAYSMLEPFGQPRADDCTRLMAYLFANANRAKNARPIELSDFLQTWEPPVVQDDAAKLAALVATLDARSGG